ncbi:type III secretion system chaperone [Ramlibacter rhizophilus]|uniref:Type III secretion system chaperone n=1 Tax=Ramlibacter rhizophilus TaxID=1781167 RepID=A0A4Z0BQB5_9BURK|nr:type III secretion system chaperone [Ramlibacter rhizophilus]TFZ01506.1 hypothetical protein EZ242_09035 [Ramlibacter rhizophilus]
MHRNTFTDDQQRVDRWLRALGQKAGLPLALDAQGVCAVGHASGLACAVEVGAGEVFFRVPLMDWEPGHSASLAEFCLGEHFLGLATSGASFAIDRDEAELVLWRSMPLVVLDEASFAAALMDLLEAASHWREQLQGVLHRSLAPSGATSPASLSSGLA